MITQDELQRRQDLWAQGYWEVPDNLDTSNFNFDWRPDPWDRPYIHQFGTQWQKTGGPRFIVPDNEGIKYQNLQIAIRTANHNDRAWRPMLPNIEMDYSWHPDGNDPPYIYVFGNQHYGPELMPTVMYRVKGATEKKYITSVSAKLLPNKEKFSSLTSVEFDFDYSWVPHPYDPPYNYVFGNQHHDSKSMPTVMYNVEGAHTTKYVDDVIATLIADKSRWEIPEHIDDSMFDYSWYPSIHEPKQTYQFGTQWQKTGGPRLVVGNTNVKFMDTMRIVKLPDSNNRAWRPLFNVEFDYSWHPDDNDPPYNYVFGNQWHSSERMPTLIYRVKGATESKFMDINATLLANKDNYRSLTDVEFDFDYSWVPDPHDPPYNYVFGNQWHDSRQMPTVMYCVKGATTTKYVDAIKATLKSNKSNWIIPTDINDSEFDYSWVPDPNEPPYIYQFGTQWQKTGGPQYIVRGATHTKFIDVQKAIKFANMRNWRIIEPIVNDKFDFSWHPDATEENYTYLFGNQYFDPEQMPTLMYKSKQTVGNKYVTDIKADLDIKIIKYIDSIYESVVDNKFDTAYALFTNNDTIDCSLYIGDKIDTLHVVGDCAIVPRSCRTQIHDKLTDYYNVVKHSDRTITPLDIIFFSNGEACADENLDHLLSLNLPNRIVHIKGVQGRVASQHAAANASNTHWYFLVNAKLKVNENFDFNWQPDIYKSRRHYIFRATNPVNGLEYGHQAMVANNKILTLNTVVRGLDFTMDSAHEVVNINSGVSRYNTSEWDTYRTSFRECIKLKHYGDKESLDRLNTWLTIANGDFAQYSLLGAKDAVDYYNSVNGDIEQLKLSYDWAWIKERFEK
jgi:hypothetical protein